MDISGGTLGFLLKTTADNTGISQAEQNLSNLDKSVQGIQNTFNTFKNVWRYYKFL